MKSVASGVPTLLAVCTPIALAPWWLALTIPTPGRLQSLLVREPTATQPLTLRLKVTTKKPMFPVWAGPSIETTPLERVVVGGFVAETWAKRLVAFAPAAPSGRWHPATPERRGRRACRGRQPSR